MNNWITGPRLTMSPGDDLFVDASNQLDVCILWMVDDYIRSELLGMHYMDIVTAAGDVHE